MTTKKDINNNAKQDIKKNTKVSYLSKPQSFSCDGNIIQKFNAHCEQLRTNKSSRIQYLIKKDLIESKALLPNKNEKLCSTCGGLITKVK